MLAPNAYSTKVPRKTPVVPPVLPQSRRPRHQPEATGGTGEDGLYKKRRVAGAFALLFVVGVLSVLQVGDVQLPVVTHEPFPLRIVGLGCLVCEKPVNERIERVVVRTVCVECPIGGLVNDVLFVAREGVELSRFDPGELQEGYAVEDGHGVVAWALGAPGASHEWDQLESLVYCSECEQERPHTTSLTEEERFELSCNECGAEMTL